MQRIISWQRKKKLKKLTPKELDIMHVFWKNKLPMTAAEVKNNSDINPNTVLVCIKSLLKNGFIEVADIVYSGTVLSRAYKACVTEEEYTESYYMDISQQLSATPLIKHFIDNTTDLNELNELEKYIEEKRAELFEKN